MSFNQDHPSKKAIFLVKSLENWGGYDNFPHRNPTISKRCSHENTYNITWITWWSLFGDVMDENYHVITFISKYHCFKKAWNSYFCWHHQNCNHVYLKKLLKIQEKLKELQIMYQNPIYICISWCGKICWSAVKKCWCQKNSKDESRDLYIYFWIFFR